jgi:DNA-binding IclR family transcriptional regulator
MSEQLVNLPLTYFGVFSRAEQRALQSIFKAIAKGGGTCAATMTMLARDSNTSKATTRNAITRAVETGLLEKTERRPYCYLSLQTSWLREAIMAAHGVGDARASGHG